MTSIKKRTATIHCDGCGYEMQAHIPDYHGKACEKCGHTPINSDSEMEVLNSLQILYDMGIAFNPEDSEARKQPHVTVRFNTANLNR